MNILALCTAVSPTSVALYHEQTLLAAYLQAHPGEELMSRIQALCIQAACPLKKVHIIAAVHGPGAFTGLRIGLVTAKTLAQTLEKKLVTVDALEAVAMQAGPSVQTVLVLQKACRDEYNMALFGVDSLSAQDPLRRLTPNAVVHESQAVEILAQTQGPVTVTGDGAALIYPLARKRNKPGLIYLVSGGQALLTAQGVALRAYVLAKQKKFADPLHVKPIYSHPPNVIYSKNIDYEKLRNPA